MSDLVGVLEAAYRFDGDESDWLGGVLEEMRGYIAPGHAALAFFHDHNLPAYVEPTRAITVGLDERIGAMIAHGTRASGPQIAELTQQTPAVASASSVLGEKWTQLLPMLRGVLASAGVEDVFTLRCEDTSGRGCALSVTIPQARTFTRGEIETWSRVAAHVTAALRLRRNDDADEPEAMLTPGGKVEHAVGVAKERVAREALIRASGAIDRARGRLRRTSPTEAVEIWRALVAGRWSLVDHFDTDGRRYVIARRNEPAPAVTLAALTQREREVLAFAALGHSNKLIAYELGLATTTVAAHLASAAKKLGADGRVELIRIFEQARPKGGS